MNRQPASTNRNQMAPMNETPRYYVPHSSIWPIVGSIALFLTAYGGVNFIHQSTEKVAAEGSYGGPIFFIGLATIAFMMFGWFGTVIRESLKGIVSQQLDRITPINSCACRLYIRRERP